MEENSINHQFNHDDQQINNASYYIFHHLQGNSNNQQRSSTTQITGVYVMLITLDTTLIIVSALLNVLGVYLLAQLKRPKNIHLILVHLSCSEIAILINRLVSAIYFFYYNNYETCVGYQVTRTLAVQGFCVVYVLLLVVVALDPLLVVTLKLAYQRKVSKQRIHFLLTTCWVVGVVSGAGSFASTYKTRERISITYTFPVTTAIFLVFSLASYITVYNQVRNHGKSIRGAIASTTTTMKTVTPSLHSRRPTLRRFRVPVLITSTFFLFCLTPSIIQVSLGKERFTKNIMLTIGICFSLGFVLDSIIYMTLNPMVKKVFHRLMNCWTRTRGSHNSNVSIQPPPPNDFRLASIPRFLRQETAT